MTNHGLRRLAMSMFYCAGEGSTPGLVREGGSTGSLPCPITPSQSAVKLIPHHGVPTILCYSIDSIITITRNSFETLIGNSLGTFYIPR